MKELETLIEQLEESTALAKKSLANKDYPVNEIMDNLIIDVERRIYKARRFRSKFITDAELRERSDKELSRNVEKAKVEIRSEERLKDTFKRKDDNDN